MFNMKKFVQNQWPHLFHALVDLIMAGVGIWQGTEYVVADTADKAVVWYICAACWLFLAGGWWWLAIRKNREGK